MSLEVTERQPRLTNVSMTARWNLSNKRLAGGRESQRICRLSSRGSSRRFRADFAVEQRDDHFRLANLSVAVGEYTSRAPGFVPVANVQLLTRVASAVLSSFVMASSVVVVHLTQREDEHRLPCAQLRLTSMRCGAAQPGRSGRSSRYRRTSRNVQPRPSMKTQILPSLIWRYPAIPSSWLPPASGQPLKTAVRLFWRCGRR